MSDPKSDPHGTVRRQPAPSFAHAIKLDQGSAELDWMVIDVYGPLWHDTMSSGDEVKDWPVVYVPMPDQFWKTVEYTTRDGCSCQTITWKQGPNHTRTDATQCLDHFLDD